MDDDVATPDIIVYEQGGVQVEDFFVDAAVVGGLLAGNPVRSTATDNQPERRLDLTDVIGGAGMVQRIQIIDIVADGDEVEPEGFEAGWGADIDAVACISQATGTGGTGGGITGGTGGMAGGGVDGGSGVDGGCECSLQSGNIVGDGFVWLVAAGLWLGHRLSSRSRDQRARGTRQTSTRGA